MGARKVDLCFSAASMKIQKMSWAVRNISMNTPRVIEVPAPRLVRTERGPGKVAETIPAAAMAPHSCAAMRRAALSQGTAPISAIAKVTFISLATLIDDGWCR
jgi:hypothetical protein